MARKPWLIAVIFGLIVPGIAYRTIELTMREKSPVLELQPVATTQPAVAVEETKPENKVDILFDGTVVPMELETYLTGVVLAEMPADFELEALKAQAVAARTYTLKNKKHSQALACTDPSCCQAYCSEEDYLAGGHSREALEKIRQAVTDTKGQVLLYQGQLIDATYFSCSGGKTEEALAVWGRDVPYLQSVDSPGEEQAAHYVDTVHLDWETFARLLQLTDTAEPRIGEITYTAGGGVDTISICGKDYTGIQIRKLLGLRSTAFVITVLDKRVTITTKGFGHRVGMSQYGADAMAAAGKSYEQILAHYYPGTELTAIGN